MSESRSIEIKLKQTSTGETETIYITQEGKEFIPEYVFTIDEGQRKNSIQSDEKSVMLGLLTSYKTTESGGTKGVDWTLDDDSVRGDGADLDVNVQYGYDNYQYVYVTIQNKNEDTYDKTIYFTIVQNESGKTLDFTVTVRGKEEVIDTNPKWTSTGELGCSSSSSSYREKTDIYADGYAFVKYRDTNPNSSSYNDTEWRRASNRDDECVGQVNTSPKWEYVDSSSYGCSSNSYSFNEKTDPYADGYAFRLQKDTNPDSNTYGDTKWVRYSSWDSKCVGKERPYQPTYTFTADDYDVTGDSSINITSHKTVKEGGTTHVQWTVDEITGDGTDLIEKAVSAGGNTSLTIKVKENSDTSDKKAAITLRQNESGKTIKINVTISGKVVSNDKFAPCNRKYTYNLNCDFRPIIIPICSVYNNQSAKPTVHSYDSSLFEYVRIKGGAGLFIGWSSKAIKSTEDFSTAITLQQEGSGKTFDIIFNVITCPSVEPSEPCELTTEPESITFTLKNYDFDSLESGFTTESITQYVDYNLSGNCGGSNIKWEYESFLPSDYENAIICDTYDGATETQGSVSITFMRNHAPYIFDYIRKYEGSDRMQVGEIYIGDLDSPQVEKPFDTAVIPVYVITILE